MAIEIDLCDHVAIVTGGGRGIGEAIATKFGEAGANVIIAARTESEIKDTASTIQAKGSESVAIRTDITNPDDIDNLINETTKTMGPPSILVNNAGVNISRKISDFTVDELNTMIDVNLRGPFLLSQRFGQAFRQSTDYSTGRIINISSVYAGLGVPTKTGYGMTKSGIYGLTKGLAADFASDGITVNSITPGRIKIARTEEVMKLAGDSFDISEVPLGELGAPEDVANACLFIASSYAGYITGADVLVDGGISFTSGPYPSTKSA